MTTSSGRSSRPAATLLAADIGRSGLSCVPLGEPLRHLGVPPDGIELELVGAAVDDPVVGARREVDDVAGPERGPLPGRFEFGLAGHGDEDLVLMMSVRAAAAAWLDHHPGPLERRVEHLPGHPPVAAAVVL